MQRFRCVLLASLVVAFPSACKRNSPQAEQSAQGGGEGEAAQPSASPGAAEQPGTITVTAAGANIDPATQPERLPEGAWYCDMGTVHWAAMTKPESGKCPRCEMVLKQFHAAKHAAEKQKAVQARGHDHSGEGHAHGHGGGEHEHGAHGHEH